MLTKMVDGKSVVMSDDEEAAIRAEWDANKPQPFETPVDRLQIVIDYISQQTDAPQSIKSASTKALKG